MLQLPVPELQLVSEVRRNGCHEVFECEVTLLRRRIRYAECEDMRDKVGMPEGYTVGKTRAPVFY